MSDGLARELCARLGTPFPTTWSEVGSLYRRWCAEIPFDTIAKSIAVREGTTIPGADAVEVIERWLATGVGSTCWGHCTAFAGLLASAGIEARIAVDRAVRDDGVIDFHSFVLVDHEEEPWVFDQIHFTGDPVRFRDGERGGHGLYEAGFRAADGRMLHWFDNPQRSRDGEHYVVLATDLDLDDVRAFCEISRHFSGIRSGRLYSRRFPADGFVHGFPTDDGSAMEVHRWSGDTRSQERHVDPDEALAALGYPPGAGAPVERAGMVAVADSVARWSVV